MSAEAAVNRPKTPSACYADRAQDVAATVLPVLCACACLAELYSDAELSMLQRLDEADAARKDASNKSSDSKAATVDAVGAAGGSGESGGDAKEESGDVPVGGMVVGGVRRASAWTMDFSAVEAARLKVFGTLPRGWDSLTFAAAYPFSTRTGLSHAIVVTNSTFADLPDLPEAVKQRSLDFADVLKSESMGGLNPEHVTHLENASATDLELAVNRTARACSAQSTVLVFITSRAGRVRRGLQRGSYIIMSDTVRGMHGTARLLMGRG